MGCRWARFSYNAPVTWLHVAAMPFPTRQGTQNVVREMCAASAAAGRDTHLFTYAAGAALDGPPAFTLHRVGDFPRVRSMRSGPSVGKVLLDARMAVELARLVRRIRPTVVIAHHVEAAALAALVAKRFVFFAHTDLEAELPTYGPARMTAALARAGALADRMLAGHAGAVATISPMLAERMRARVRDTARVRFVPAAWPVPAATSDAERAQARSALGLAPDASVVLYAGNLDAYQDWERVIDAFAMLANQVPDARLLVGTASDRTPLDAATRRAGVAPRVSVHAIDTESARRRLHASADVVGVPRRAPGGLPVKLLDALARGTPCAVTPTATAGLRFGAAVHMAKSDDASALSRALREVLADARMRRDVGAAGRVYVAEHHSRAQCLDALDEVAALAR